MPNQPPSLSAALAELRTAAAAADGQCWLVDSAIEMIMACLVRLFTRLEQLVQLWQAGQLPPPVVRGCAPRAAATNRARTARRRQHARKRCTTRRIACSRPARHQTIPRASAPNATPMTSAHPRPRHSHARDPPRDFSQKTRQKESHPLALNVPI